MLFRGIVVRVNGLL